MAPHSAPPSATTAPSMTTPPDPAAPQVPAIPIYPTYPADLAYPTTQDAAAIQARRLGRFAWLTVVGWHIFAVAAVWAWAAIATATYRHDDAEEWTGLVIVIAFLFMAVSAVVSLAISLPIVLRRIHRPTWPAQATSARAAVLAGVRACAWGLIALLPLPLILVGSWVVNTVNG